MLVALLPSSRKITGIKKSRLTFTLRPSSGEMVERIIATKPVYRIIVAMMKTYFGSIVLTHANKALVVIAASAPTTQELLIGVTWVLMKHSNALKTMAAITSVPATHLPSGLWANTRWGGPNKSVLAKDYRLLPSANSDAPRRL